ncbi:MAG: hypothetical protein HY922_01680 [Elusimicrobia bacterium]|nr:hypothetical protein [Elusimicrobiota bacterium]
MDTSLLLLLLTAPCLALAEEPKTAPTAFQSASGIARNERDPLVGSVVRSREYVIRRAPTKQEEFIGDVSYRRASRSARADWALFDHASQVWKLRGSVHGEDRLKDRSGLSVDGHEAVHNVDTGLGELRGQGENGLVTLIRNKPGPEATDRAYARKLSWDQKGGTLRLLGDVRLDSPMGEAAAWTALYRHSDRSLTLTGGPPLVAPRQRGWQAAAQADEIRATERPQKIQAAGSVRGWLFFPPEEPAASRGPSGLNRLWPFKPPKK